MNRILNIAHPWATLCLMLTLLASCSEKTIDPSTPLPPTDATPIAFSTEDAFTKAVIDSKEDLEVEGNKFRVWSHFQGTTSGPMFTEVGTEVEYKKLNEESIPQYDWTYSPTRYWMNGTYNFAAVYPSSVSGTYAPATQGAAPTLTVNNFDVTDQHDLLVAFNNGTDGTGINGATPPATVDLNFQHTLSLVQIELKLDKADFFECETDENGNLKLENNEPIILKNEDGTKKQLGYAYVASAGFSNMSKVATLTGSAPDNMNWSLSSEKGDISFEYSLPDSDATITNYIAITDEYTETLGDGMLLLPQTFDAENAAQLKFKLWITFPYITDRITEMETTVDLNKLSTQTWEPNKKYIYTGTIHQDFKIEFNIVRVVDWEDETLGGVIVN